MAGTIIVQTIKKYFPGLIIIFGIILYLFTRLWRISDFPIYFFTDEAHIVNFGVDLIKHKFIGSDKILFPLYFEQAPGRYMPLLSVYFLGFAATWFGRSVTVVRSTQAILSVLIPLSVTLALKYVYKIKWWWLGLGVTSIIPTLFLHSRTDFETISATSFYGVFLLFYLFYLSKNKWYILPAIFCAFASFYSYSNAQIIVLCTGLLLLFSDLRYHLKNWKQLFIGIMVIGMLSIPLFIFQQKHTNALSHHLCTIGSYWCSNISIFAKLHRYGTNYLHGFSFNYWFMPDTYEVIRHRMLGTGKIQLYLFPFFLIGIIAVLANLKKPMYRVLIITALCSPAGAALEDIGITRVMIFIIPAIILICIGLNKILIIVSKYINSLFVGFVIVIALSFLSVQMLFNAVNHGSTWFTDYGMFGMQYGEKILFTNKIIPYLKIHHDAHIYVSPSWANSPENFITFFLPETYQNNVMITGIEDFTKIIKPMGSNDVVVATSSELHALQQNPIFSVIKTIDTITYPDGTNGFNFIKLQYSTSAPDIISQKIINDHLPVTENIKLFNTTVHLTHSQISSGTMNDIFDDNKQTLIRGSVSNPFVIHLNFDQQQNFSGFDLTTGSLDYELKIKILANGNTNPIELNESFAKLGPDPTVHVDFSPTKIPVQEINLEIRDINKPGDAQIHIRELKLL
jgi:hypothetical protein